MTDSAAMDPEAILRQLLGLDPGLRRERYWMSWVQILAPTPAKVAVHGRPLVAVPLAA